MTTLTDIPLNRLLADEPDGDRADVMKLARSIAEDGLQEPLTVTPEGDSYRVVDGRRRLRAIRLLFQQDADVYDREHGCYHLARTIWANGVPCEILSSRPFVETVHSLKKE